MTKHMLIDTTHAEETRVVVMDGERLEEYDVETSARKQLKGNIYLAKVIRVEPSLQAAFVEYGGNRHGFLAFSEIHPDYFQIPVADREKLLALQEEEARAEDARQDAEFSDPSAQGDIPAESDESGSETGNDATDESAPEMVGGENDTGEEGAASRRMARFLRGYKIQEVIRRRQILLIQVVKEERGNKGAALTTYISLAGRYCVLMPNALRGGGVSRKITSESDRRRLRDIISGLDLPRGMAMIVRTAGAQRPGPEITRDCEYLLQLWDDIRSHTLSSVAPALIYEEASLIKRAIRDLYTKDIEDILIDGEAAWKSAREFMRLLMPHNVNRVKLWRDQSQTLFARYRVEGMLDAMFSPTAQLRSGGYLVINQTEALVSIDVNSGRSTSQRNIEETALRTNLEAAEEVARQLRLRDLAGLVVIDFIDMESRKHNHMVEKRLKEALRSDRARIQIGAISHFGLLEMSRQRLRPSLAESLLTPCPHCQGTGFMRGTESAALHVLRAVDEEGALQKAAEIEAAVAPGVAFYILNNKRSWLGEIETRHRMHVTFLPDEALLPSEVKIERIRPQTDLPPARQHAAPIAHAPAIEDDAEEPRGVPATTDDGVIEPSIDSADPVDDGEQSAASEGREDGRRRRRRRRGRGRDRRQDQAGDERTGDENTSIGSGGAHSRAAQPDATQDGNAPVEAGTRDAVRSTGDEAAEEFVVPGRRRTRFRRASQPEQDSSAAVEATPSALPESSAPASGVRAERRGAGRPDRSDDRRRPELPQRPWTGPTPADPFGGAGFDIFDVIEQAEFAHDLPAAKRKNERAERGEAVPSLANSAPPTDDVKAGAAAEVPSAPVEAPVKRRRGRPRKTEATAVDASDISAATTEIAEAKTGEEVAASAPASRKRATTARAAKGTVTQSAEQPPARRRGRKPAKDAPPADDTAPADDAPEAAAVVTPIDVDDVTPARPRMGWWRR